MQIFLSVTSSTVALFLDLISIECPHVSALIPDSSLTKPDQPTYLNHARSTYKTCARSPFKTISMKARIPKLLTIKVFHNNTTSFTAVAF